MAPIAVQVCFRGWQLALDDTVDFKVWTSGHELIATLPGWLIRNLVEHHLTGAVLGHEMQALVRKPPAILPSSTVREQRRLQRRSRRQK
jgi:hypothetical protein